MGSWKNGRPDGWDARKLIPEFYDIKILEGGEWVDEKLHSLDHLAEVYAFEAGADAMLEALKRGGFHGHYQDGVDEGPWIITDDGDYITFDELVKNKNQAGTVVFIPDEEAKE